MKILLKSFHFKEYSQIANKLKIKENRLHDQETMKRKQNLKGLQIRRTFSDTNSEIII